MIAETKHPPLRLLAVVLAAALLFTACVGGAKSKVNQLELGRKYLTEMNYSEAIAAFTEAIKLNPDDIEAYLGRAEAYAAMGEYEKALADYDTVLEKSEDDPYTQAQAYAGRAEVDEQADQPEEAERDYAAALTQLDKNMDVQDTVAVLTLKKDVLAKHAAVCITLALLDKAADDYDALEQLGENVAAKRKELESLLPDSGTSSDAENGLNPDAPDADTPADAGTPADTGTEPEAPAEEQPASSKEEPAESKPVEQPAESKAEEQPVQQTQSYTATATDPWKNEAQSGYSTTTDKVSYQVGETSIKVQRDWVDTWTNYAEPGVQHSRKSETTEIYTLSQPLQGMKRQGQWQVIWDVPAGTKITKTYNESSSWDGEDSGTLNYTGLSCRIRTSDNFAKEEDLSTIQWREGIDYTSGDTITVEKDKYYVEYDIAEGGMFTPPGGCIFHGV